MFPFSYSSILLLFSILAALLVKFLLWDTHTPRKESKRRIKKTMDTLIGVLLDVSGSMEASIGKRPNQENCSWARSIFRVVDSLIKHDVSSSNHVFALGFGASREPQSFDLLGTVKANTKPLPQSYKNKSKFQIIEEILTILEENGAPRVRTWAKMNVLLHVIERTDACTFAEEIRHNDTFKTRFVMECLPESCRKVIHSARSYCMETANFVTNKLAPEVQEYATRDSVKEVVAKGKKLMKEVRILELVPIGQEAIMDVKKASEILHGGIGEDKLTDERVDELMDTVEPLIYGGTPLMTTIGRAADLFSTSKFGDHSKLMFIISDGVPGDGYNPPIAKLDELSVATVCCYITNDEIDDPKRLYSTESETWDKAAKLMFTMSSTITTQDIPRTIFVKRGWTIDITNNETRLFAQVNHPDIIEDVCDLAKDVVCCQEAMSDLLATVSLDLYINQANQGFHPKQQVGGTCYANASAAVLHLSMQRIVERKGGYPDFFELRREMIQKYGQHGANTLSVLEDMCPQYRLHCKEVDAMGALKAITAKRPVLARFWLTDSEWDIFDDFYKQSPQNVLTSATLDIKQRPLRADKSGHAVVLTSFNSECLTLMNSWGSNWGNGGFFKVANADVLGLEFVDVFWTKEDLMPSEIEAYDRYGPSIARKMFSKLLGLQKMDYPCPSCHQRSNVNEFSGNHLEAKCPKCRRNFKIKKAGDDLALNMYLLSLTSNRRCQESPEVWQRKQDCCLM